MAISSAALMDDDIFLDTPYRDEPIQESYTASVDSWQSLDQIQKNYLVEKQILFPPSRWKSANAFRAKSSWEGIVISNDGNTVCARIHPRDTANSDLIDEVEIDIHQVSEGDRGLVREGALFYLSSGKICIEGGIPQPSLSIVFRRQPAWSKRDLKRRDEIADELEEIMRVSE